MYGMDSRKIAGVLVSILITFARLMDWVLIADYKSYSIFTGIVLISQRFDVHLPLVPHLKGGPDTLPSDVCS